MIDVASGRVSFDSGLTLRAGMSLEDVREALPNTGVTERKVPPRWVWLTVREQQSRGATFIASMEFEDEALTRINLCKKGHGGAGWDTWSEAAEMERKAAHDRWLESALGAPPYEYAWGGITSLFDLRTGGSTVVIRYGRRDAVRSFFDEVREAAASLGAGHEVLAKELVEAIEAGSTGSEIMMRLRAALRGACHDTSLALAQRVRLRGLLEQVESVLE